MNTPRLLVVLALAGLLMGLAACSTNPTTGRRQFNALSRDQEIALGAQSTPDLIEQFGGKVPSAELQSYVTTIGRAMAVHTEGENPSLPWEFTLLNSEEVNAFALPGGKTFITRGLARRLTNEAQLAGVMGHEIGHVTARHANDAIARATGTQLAGGLLAVLAGAALGGNEQESAEIANTVGTAVTVGGQVILLKYGRDQEHEADSLGVRYMTKAGYNPQGLVQVMQVFESLSAKGGSGPQWLSTHPLPADRVQRLRGIIAGEYGYTQTDPRFQTFEQRYQQQFLRRLAVLPEPGAELIEPGRFALDDPRVWCGHCAAAAAAARLERLEAHGML